MTLKPGETIEAYEDGFRIVPRTPEQDQRRQKFLDSERTSMLILLAGRVMVDGECSDTELADLLMHMTQPAKPKH